MSHASRISTVGTRPLSLRRPALVTLAVVIAFVVVIATVTILIATGSGAGTQSSVASDTSPYPGLSQQAEQATRQPEVGATTHPRSVPPLRFAPSRGSAQIVPSH
jgi:hypothetical protein